MVLGVYLFTGNEFTLEGTLQTPLPAMKSETWIQDSRRDAGEGASRRLHFVGTSGEVRRH